MQTYDTLAAAIGRANRAAMPEITKALWAAHGQGWIDDDGAAALDAAIQARFAVVTAVAPAPRRSVGSRPRTPASLMRRRRWAASGRIPPEIAEDYTHAQQGVLSLVAAQVAAHGYCDWPMAQIAAAAGVAYATVKATLKRARDLGHILSEERPQPGGRHLPSIVTIVAPVWTDWLKKRRLPPPADMLAPASCTGGISTSFWKGGLKRKSGLWATGMGKRASQRESRYRRAS